MNKQYYLDCLNRGTRLYWHTLAKVRGMSLHPGDIEWVMSVPRGGVERIFNINLPKDSADKQLDELIAMIGRDEAPSGILVTPNSKPDNITELLAAKGFCVDYDTGSGMAMDIDASVTRMSYADNISIVQVETADTLGAWIGIVNAALFGEELFSFEQFHDLLMMDNIYFNLGLLDSHPAATCMAMVDGDVATIEMVSTLQEYRKNGLATAAVIETLKKLYRLGIKTVILRAEKEAVNVYRRVGFIEYYKRVVATYGE